MDATSAWVEQNFSLVVRNFCIMSEVPFVAWMAGVDPRVKCSIPIVTDLVNATATFERQYRYGNSSAFVMNRTTLAQWRPGATYGRDLATFSTLWDRETCTKCSVTWTRPINRKGSTRRSICYEPVMTKPARQIPHSIFTTKWRNGRGFIFEPFRTHYTSLTSASSAESSDSTCPRWGTIPCK